MTLHPSEHSQQVRKGAVAKNSTSKLAEEEAEAEMAESPDHTRQQATLEDD